MGNTWDEASAVLTAPGQPFELIDASVNGITMQVFKNAPPHLGYVFGAARQHGDKPFLVYEDERMSFAEAMQQVDALSCLLVNTYGIKKGDRVAVAMRNYPEWVMSFAAIISIGAVSVSMNSWWTADEMEFALEDSGSKVLICDDQRLALAYSFCQKQNIAMLLVRAEGDVPAGVGQWEKDLPLGSAHPGADISPDDDATILYTSGTTGRPKGAVSTHRAIISALMGFSLRVAVDNLREGTKPDPNALPTSFILIVPLFHVTGCIPVMMSCWVAGLKLVIMYKWDAEKALELISREKVTNFVGVPTQSWDLVNHPRFSDFDMSSMKAIGGGGAPAPAALVDKVAKSFKGGGPQLGYGMTETNAFGPGNRGADYISHPTSTGRTCLPMKLEVRDEQLRPLPVGERGEIWFFGPTLIRGYWNRRSGDIGRVDEDGFVYVEDRVKDMILRGGENIFCAEVEGAIYEHSKVHEVAVFGVPHERLGEEVAVAILPNDGVVLTPEEIWTFLDGKIANYKIPTHVIVMQEALPRNAAGKFLKREMQELFVQGKLVATASR